MIDKYCLAKKSQNLVNIERVLFQPRLTETTFAVPGFTLYRVQRSKIVKDIKGGGKPLARKLDSFRFYQTDLASAGAPAPKLKDQLTDQAGIVYYVIDTVEVVNRGTEFVLKCQAQI